MCRDVKRGLVERVCAAEKRRFFCHILGREGVRDGEGEGVTIMEQTYRRRSDCEWRIDKLN